MKDDKQSSVSNPDSRSDEAVHEVTMILQAINAGASNRAEDLIPLVYEELRRLAAYRMSREKPGQTLQATALVHEAFLRLLKSESQSWRDRRHFFGAAAEAMRRILIENARRKAALKRGGEFVRTNIPLADIPVRGQSVDILDLNTALEDLEKEDPSTAELVKLRYFAGLTWNQIAETLEVSPRTARNIWTYGKVWLFKRLNDDH